MILSAAQEAVDTGDVLHEAWGGHPRSADTALALVHRVWFCKMRLVSPGWRDAGEGASVKANADLPIDSHPFWPEFALTLEPSRRHSSAVSDLQASRLTASSPTSPTLFHRARLITLRSCIACRLNRPDSLGLYPAIRKYLVVTSKFGLAPTCVKHAGKFCTGCMREVPDEDKRTAEVEPGLIPCKFREVDEYGEIRPGYRPLVCYSCRWSALKVQIELLLIECARGGPVRGLQSNWQDTYAFKDYIEDSIGTAVTMAVKVVEEQWFMDHTRWEELLPTAHAMQKNERGTRRQYKESRQEESDVARLTRWRLHAEMRGEEGYYHTDDDEEEMICLYRQWWKLPRECDKDDEWDLCNAGTDEVTIEPSVTARIREVALRA